MRSIYILATLLAAVLIGFAPDQVMALIVAVIAGLLVVAIESLVR